MDQLKLALNVLKKYHFWILLTVVLLVGLFIWHTASASMSEQYAKRKADLESKKKAVSEIASASNPPNLQVVEAIKQQHNKLREEVYQAWMYLYQLQQQNNPWPNLGPEFAQMIAQLTAEELKNPDSPPEIPVEFRDLYLNFIQEHVKTLGDIIQTRRPKDLFEEEGAPGKKDTKDAQAKEGSASGNASDTAGSEKSDGASAKKSAASGSSKSRRKATATVRGGTPGMAMPGTMSGVSPEAVMGGYGTGAMSGVEMVGVVDWLDEANLLARFNWATTPTTQEIRLAQEDLWVYEALLRIIAETNRPATTQYGAVVKKIFSLEIAQQAAMAFQSAALGQGGGLATMPGMGGMYGPGYPGMSGMPSGYPGMPEMGSSAMGTGAAGSSASGTSDAGTRAAGAAPSGTPDMPGASGLAGTLGMPGMPGSGTPVLSRAQMLLHYRYVDLNGNPLPADAKPPFAEFKMMPVRMYLLVDQRRLHRLLANCANSSMPVEVRRVRIRPEQGLDMSAFSAAAMMGGAGGMGGYPGGTAGYPGGTPGYPGAMGGYPGATPGGYPGATPGMSGMPGAPSGMPPGYPGGAPGGPTGLMGPSMATPGIAPGGASEMPGAGPYGYGGTGTVMTAEESWDVPVEILGIIYIFNPPNRSKLGTGAATLATASGVQPAEAASSAPVVPTGPAPPAQAPAAVPAGTVAPGVAPAGGPGTAPPSPPDAGPAVGTPAPAGGPSAAPPGPNTSVAPPQASAPSAAPGGTAPAAPAPTLAPSPAAPAPATP